jgi:hypothetical protein
MCASAQLRVQRAVGNGDAQHRRMALDVQAVLQPQMAELVVGQLAGEEALGLGAVGEKCRTRSATNWRSKRVGGEPAPGGAT